MTPTYVPHALWWVHGADGSTPTQVTRSLPREQSHDRETQTRPRGWKAPNTIHNLRFVFMFTDLQAVYEAIQEAQAAETRAEWIEAQNAWARAFTLMSTVATSHATNKDYRCLMSTAEALDNARASAASMARATFVRQQTTSRLVATMKTVKKICS